MIWAAWLAITSPAHACSSAALQEAIDALEQAYLSRDLVALQEADEAIKQRLRCLEEPLSAPLVRALYQAAALRGLTAQPRDEEAIRALLAGLLAVAPEAPLEPGLVQPGTLLPRLLEQAHELPASPTEAPTLPAGCCASFDGAADAPRPLERPTLLQLLDDEGGVLYSGWLPPQAPVPTEPCPPPAAVVITELPAAEEARPPAPGRRLRIAGGAGLAASGGLALGALWLQQQHAALDEQPDTGLTTAALAAEEQRLRRTGNTLSALALGSSAASAAALVVGVTAQW